MPFPTTSLLDNFNRADGGLGGNWTAPVDSGDSTPTVASNAWSSGTSVFGSSYWSAASFNADQEVYVDVNAANTHRLYLRISGGSWYRLEIDYSFSPDQAQIRYWNGSSYTTVATASGDITSAQAFGFEAIGTTLTGYVKIGGTWSTLVSGTDSNLTGGGNIGIGAFSATLDNFSGGSAVIEDPIENDRPPFEQIYDNTRDHANMLEAISRSSDGDVVLRNGDATTMSFDIPANVFAAQQYYTALKAADDANSLQYLQTLDGEEVALDGPVAYWGMGEYGGVRRSSVVGRRTVVDGLSEFTNTSAADAVASDSASSPTSRRYAVLTSTDQSYLEKPQDSNLNFSGAPFSGVVLVRMDSLSQDQFIATQTVFSGSNRGWQIYYSLADNRFKFGMSTTGADMQTVLANNFGAPSTATWYTVAFGWDGSNIWVSVNGGSRNTTAVGSAMFNTTAAVRVGYRDGLPLDAGVAALGLWKRAITDAEISAIYNGGTYADPIPVVTPSSLWNADFEVGDLSEWNAHPASGAEQTNGTFTSASSTTYARSGTTSWRTTIDTTGNTGADTDGVRLFRSLESQARTDTYHEAYFYMPATITPETPDFWEMLMQFKSNNGTTTDPFWYVSINNRGGGAMYLRLFKWQATQRWYEQNLVDLPTGQWVKISARYIQASGSTGRVIFWQDDVLIFDIPSVPTIYSGAAGPAQWAINNYSAKTQPNPAIVHFDDAAVYDPSQAGILTSDPTGVTASSPASGQIQVDWTALGGASSYAVYLATSSREYTTQYAAATNTKLITGLGAGTYYVYVVGINASGKYSGASAEVSVSVGGGGTIQAGPGFAVAFALAASLSSTSAISAGPGFVRAVPNAAAVTTTTAMSAGPAFAGAFGTAATVAPTTQAQAGPGYAQAFGLAASIANNTAVSAGPARVQAVGIAASLADTTAISAGPGASFAYGLAAAVSTASIVNIDAGPGYAQAFGIAAAASDTTAISAGPGRVQAFGLAASLANNTAINAGPGVSLVYGIAATVTPTTANSAGPARVQAVGLAASLADTTAVSAGPALAQAFGLAADVTTASIININAGPGATFAYGLAASLSSTSAVSAGPARVQAFGLAAALSFTSGATTNAGPAYSQAYGLAASVSVTSNSSISAGPALAQSFGIAASLADTTQAAPGVGYAQAFGLSAAIASTTQASAGPGNTQSFGLAAGVFASSSAFISSGPAVVSVYGLAANVTSTTTVSAGPGFVWAFGVSFDTVTAFMPAVSIHTFDARGVHHYTRTRIGTHSFDARGVHHYRERKS